MGLTKTTNDRNSSTNCVPFAHLFFQEGVFPLEWKEAKLIPLLNMF